MRYFILILFIGCIASANAQTGFTLSECIDYTLNNHPTLSVYENNRSIAKAQSSQSVASYLPQVTGSANFTDNLKLQTTILPAGTFGPEPAEVQLGTQFNTVVGVDFSQTIYDQSKITGIKAGKPYEAMTKYQEELNKEVITYNTAKAYFQVLTFKEQLSLLYSNQEKYEEMLSVLQYQFEKGVVLQKDVDRAKVNLNSINYQIEDATTKEQLALNTLKNTMGMPLDSTLLVQEAIDYELFATADMHNDLSLERLTEVQINKKQIELQEINLQMQKAKFSPTLDFVGKYGSQALSQDFDDAFSDWRSFSYVGISLKLPLFTGFKRSSQVKEEKLNLENELTNFEINKRDLKLRFENAQTSVGTAYSSFQSNRDNMQLSKKLLDVTEYQYQQGVASLTDYLNDDTAYKTAQTNYINSLYNLMVTQLDYQKSQGSLLQFINTIK
ncbi:TolC family protein [Chondrinema litorale]|uniref:TolC family protein n=1 Tax=Chondrinema litorale TaxID=2994555 RepID=UPI0025434F87|nr:TolC family protein [Chondrinema litorale]UZR96400.1 TolC family protein [Chondrinema litorale]